MSPTSTVTLYQYEEVTLSNAYWILTAPQEGDAGEVVIRDTVKQIIELSPSIPKTYRLGGMLKDQLYDEGSEEVDPEVQVNWKSYSDVRDTIQASDEELKQALRTKRILEVNGFLRPLSQSYLNNALELMLNTFVSLNAPKDAIPVVDVLETLQSDHDISRDVMLQIMAWFGELGDAPSLISQASTWKMDIHAVVRQIGLGILSRHQETPLSKADFMTQWHSALGDSFEADADLALLKGNYICPEVMNLKYFPSADLPATPQERFTDLFLTQHSWDAKDIAPFLEDIAVDSKERDKLLMKYARRTVDKNGTVKYSAKSAPVV